MMIVKFPTKAITVAPLLLKLWSFLLKLMMVKQVLLLTLLLLHRHLPAELALFATISLISLFLVLIAILMLVANGMILILLLPGLFVLVASCGHIVLR